MARTTNKAEDLLTFSRASTGTALTKVAYGPELVTNGTFDTDSDWNKSINWVISAGVASNDGTSGSVSLSQDIGVEENTTYEVTFTVVSGTIYAVRLGGFASAHQVGSLAYTAGTYTFLKTAPAGSNTFLYITSNNTPGIIDNISVREVLYNDPTGTVKLISHPTNKPRVEYDANGVAKGLLIEEARTNLLTYSEDFSNWNQILNSSISLNSDVVSPFNEPVTKLTEDNANSSHYIQSPFMTANTSTRYTYSIFAKAAERDKLQLLLGQSTAWGAACAVKFNLTLGEVISIDSGTANVTASIQDYGNGWYRCIMSADRNSTVASAFAYVFLLDSSGNVTYQGDNTSGIYIWGAQFEQGSFATSYIPTSGATATRSADTASVSVDKFGYNQARGSVVVEFSTADISTTNELALSDGTNNNRIMWGLNANAGRLPYISSGGTNTVALVNNTGIQDGVASKAAMAFAPNDVASSLDGQAVATDTSATIPSGITSLYFLSANGVDNQINGHIKSINYYPTRLTDAQLQDFTATKYANIYDLLEAQNASVLFDINDKTSLRVGTNGSGTPVEGDPVGMMMDVSKTGGLTMEAYLQGATELVTNGTFDTGDLTGWTDVGGGSVVYDNGSALFTTISSSQRAQLRQVYIIPSDGIYQISMTVSDYSGLGSWGIDWDGSTIDFTGSGNGEFSFTFYATAGVKTLNIIGTTYAGSVRIDNISIKALPGYTAVSPSDAARPTLKTYNSPITSREELVSTFGWNITDGGRA